jgi:hypothetical protein
MSAEAMVVSATELARWLDCHQTYIGQLAARDILRRAPGGKYELRENVVAYIRNLRAQAANVAPSDLVKSKIQAQRLRSEQLALQLQRERLELISVDTVGTFIQDVTGALFAEFNGVAAAITRDLELRAVIDQQVDGCIGRFRDRCVHSMKALAAGERSTFAAEDEGGE